MPSSARKPEYSLFVEFPDLSAPAKKRAGCAFGLAERTGNATNGQAFLKAERRQSELHKCHKRDSTRQQFDNRAPSTKKPLIETSGFSLAHSLQQINAATL
ncbi:hypothetical protein [Limnobacter sp.]|uniref:hypothetical protein n=1 Tax=Limnobacter sp. TaxID=2003368 RepID=UPI0027B9076F|nr:hypothetical protein [Limnobacter sp.]